MIFPFTVDRILADRSRAECGRSFITVPAPGGAHVVLGGHDFAGSGDGYPIGLYAAAPLPDGETEAPAPSSDPSADAPALYWLRSRWPLRAAAFHPTRPLLVLGTGSYDGGYFFEGELVLVDLDTGEHRYLFADDCRREVRSLEWTDAHTLRLLLAPPDDWQDRAARSEGHRVDLVRPDWRTVPARSVRHADLAGPRVPAPLPEPTPPVAVPDRDGPRPGEIRSLTVLPGGDILLTADHALLERWSAEGDRRWSLPAGPDLGGGRTAAVLADGASAWVEALVPRHGGGGAFLRICLAGGTELARHTTPGAAALVTTSEGPLLVPMPGGYGERARSRFRHGPHAIFRDVPRPPCTCDCPWDDDGDCDCQCTCPECVVGDDEEVWLTTVDASPVDDGTDLAFPVAERCRRRFPWSWEPGETHFGGPGVWVGETDLVMATVRHDGRVGVPKQGFVVRRPIGEAATGTPAWVFPVDRTPTALDIDRSTDTVLVALSGGELIALDAATGTPRARGHVHVRGVPVIPTSLTVTGPGRLLLGTGDARVLLCRLAVGPERDGGA
ncbi:hypothetical protein ABZ605_24865 [Streptomyces sp. NPDC012765]|uniref:hypothetical protein n=1 Tax=Streptomyces sp. NPDC012765 TaxID=3155249 RepID=UPI0033F4675B